MPRAKNLVAARRRRKKLLALAKGYWGRRGNVHSVAKHAIEKGLQYQYRDRKARKRTFRRLWIARINAAARTNGTTYSRLVNGLKTSGIPLNRKVLADLAVYDAAAFTAVVEQATA